MRFESIVKEMSQLLIDLRSHKTSDEKNIIMNQIDSYFEDLQDKLNENAELREVNKSDKSDRKTLIKECIAILRVGYAPIFNELERISINKLKDPYKLLAFNRSYLENNLLVKVRQDFENIEKYESIELGYSNADNLPWGHTEIHVYEIDVLGNTKEFNDSIDDVTFVYESYFNLPIS